jgi:uncharacterized protein YndB with AHSA1/START domain
MQRGLIAKATVTINASIKRIWEAFVNPNIIKQCMFGTNVVSNWKEGSPILWKGEWQGKKYEDKGTILEQAPTHDFVQSFQPIIWTA